MRKKKIGEKLGPAGHPSSKKSYGGFRGPSEREKRSKIGICREHYTILTRGTLENRFVVRRLQLVVSNMDSVVVLFAE